LAVRRLAPYADPVLLPLVVTLNGLGLAMIHRIDLDLAESDSDFGPFAGAQLTWTVLGVVGFVAVLVVVRDHRRLQALTYTFGFAGLLLLLLPMVPGLGVPINGARIWIRVGPFSFQPGEIAKICLVVFFAGYLVVKRDALALAGRRFIGIDLPRGRDLGPILVAWLVSLAVLVFQRDLGSSLLFFGLFLVLLYVATERPGWLVVGRCCSRGRVRQLPHLPHVQTRVEGWLDPFSDTDTYGQIVQASTAWPTAACSAADWARATRR
jgi:cell division protein FtsW (lipid II flippase)